MTERPILFSAPMVKALLAGTKSQTRRVVKPQPEWIDEVKTTRLSGPFVWPIGALGQQCGAPITKLPYGQPGDRLWVREAWGVGKCADSLKPSMLHPGTWLHDNGGLWFPADDTQPTRPISPRGKTRPSMFMPRWASRILLEITDVRAERLWEISLADVQAEGCPFPPKTSEAAGWYRQLWEQINGPGSWAANPWVWVVEFRRIKP